MNILCAFCANDMIAHFERHHKIEGIFAETIGANVKMYSKPNSTSYTTIQTSGTPIGVINYEVENGELWFKVKYNGNYGYIKNIRDSESVRFSIVSKINYDGNLSLVKTPSEGASTHNVTMSLNSPITIESIVVGGGYLNAITLLGTVQFRTSDNIWYKITYRYNNVDYTGYIKHTRAKF